MPEISHSLFKLIGAFRTRGHLAALLDPLSTRTRVRPSSWLPSDQADHPDVVRLLRSFREGNDLDLEPFGLQNVPRDSTFHLAELKTSPMKKMWSLNELIDCLKNTYCGTVGVEFSHIENDKQRTWLEEKVEGNFGPRKWRLRTREEKMEAFLHLLRTDHTAKFLNRTFPNSKVL